MNTPQLDITFRELFRERTVPLDCLDDGEMPKANQVLNVLREKAAQHPDSPWAHVPSGHWTFEITVALWLAGLVRLVIASDASTGNGGLFACPV